MNSYQKSLIEEHSNLVVKINDLHNYVYSSKSDKDDKVEFANKCIQLASMKRYEEALRARINNTGIEFDEGKYYEKVASIQIVPPTHTEAGSDFDIDKQTIENAE